MGYRSIMSKLWNNVFGLISGIMIGFTIGIFINGLVFTYILLDAWIIGAK